MTNNTAEPWWEREGIEIMTLATPADLDLAGLRPGATAWSIESRVHYTGDRAELDEGPPNGSPSHRPLAKGEVAMRDKASRSMTLLAGCVGGAPRHAN